MAVVLEFSLSRSVDYMIIKVESQNDLTKVLNLDGYESYEIDEIHLSNARYTLILTLSFAMAILSMFGEKGIR